MQRSVNHRKNAELRLIMRVENDKDCVEERLEWIVDCRQGNERQEISKGKLPQIDQPKGGVLYQVKPELT